MGVMNWVSKNLEENSSQKELCPPNNPYRVRRIKGISFYVFLIAIFFYFVGAL